MTVDYLLCRSETKNHPNADLADLHLSDDMIELLKSGLVDNSLLCELATYPDFPRFIADLRKILTFSHYRGIHHQLLSQMFHQMDKADKLEVESAQNMIRSVCIAVCALLYSGVHSGVQTGSENLPSEIIKSGPAKRSVSVLTNIYPP